MTFKVRTMSSVCSNSARTLASRYEKHHTTHVRVADHSFLYPLMKRNVPFVRFAYAKNHSPQSGRNGLSILSPRRENRSIRGLLSQSRAEDVRQPRARLAPWNFRLLPLYRFHGSFRQALKSDVLFDDQDSDG